MSTGLKSRGVMPAAETVTPQRSLDELLHHWRAVIGRAPRGWARDFALSIQKQSGRRGWQPTDKQLGLMQGMVAELFTHAPEAEEIDLIERE